MSLMIGESLEPQEQKRTSRDFELRDSAVQSLYGIGLKLEYCIALVDESPAQAKAGLDAAISGLNELIGELRVSMSELR